MLKRKHHQAECFFLYKNKLQQTISIDQQLKVLLCVFFLRTK